MTSSDTAVERFNHINLLLHPLEIIFEAPSQLDYPRFPFAIFKTIGASLFSKDVYFDQDSLGF
ncbi:hypothetical protein BD408DRAFT_418298, partial [Parasitella parasitica]